MNKHEKLIIPYAEVQHLKATLEDCQAEFEELMRDKDWYVTEVVERIATSLEILDTAEALSE